MAPNLGASKHELISGMITVESYLCRKWYGRWLQQENHLRISSNIRIFSSAKPRLIRVIDYAASLELCWKLYTSPGQEAKPSSSGDGNGTNSLFKQQN